MKTQKILELPNFIIIFILEELWKILTLFYRYIVLDELSSIFHQNNPFWVRFRGIGSAKVSIYENVSKTKNGTPVNLVQLWNLITFQDFWYSLNPSTILLFRLNLIFLQKIGFIAFTLCVL